MKGLKINLVMVFCLLFSLSGCGSRENVKGEGPVVQEPRDVSSFSGIDVKGKYEILAQIGTPQTLAISSNKNILPYIESTVSKSILHVADKTSADLHPSVPQKITLTVPSVESLTLAGNNTFYLSNLNANKLEITLAGSQQLLLGGKADSVKVVINGTSTVDAKALAANKVDIVINGTGTVVVNPAKSLNVVINGSGKVVNYGNVTAQQVINGSGIIENAK